jgi:hypothetical protein
MTAPNVATAEQDRVENRYNRTFPALLAPWSDDGPEAETAVVVLTRDISDRGVGLVLRSPLDEQRVVVAFWLSREQMEEPWFFLGEAQHAQPLGGGYWTIGVQLREYASDDYRDLLRPLRPLAVKLLPPVLPLTGSR